MINLLPKLEKKKLHKEYLMRIGVTVLAVFFLLELFAGVVFAPSYYNVAAMVTVLTDTLAQKKKLTPEGSVEAERSLAETKEEIALLKPSSELPISVALEELMAQKPAGISILGFSFGRTGKTLAIQLSGIAKTREDLLAFQQNLIGNPHFAETKYGQSFVTQKTDISFTLNVTLK